MDHAVSSRCMYCIFSNYVFLTYNLLVPIRYVKAKHSPGELVLTGPRMDMESGEMIVTLAKTLVIRYLAFQAKSTNKLHYIFIQ